jgi:hypothetical protein
MAASHPFDKPEMLDQAPEIVEVDVGICPPTQDFGEKLAVPRHMRFLLFTFSSHRTIPSRFMPLLRESARAQTVAFPTAV